MDKASLFHVVGGLVIALLAGVSWWFGLPSWVSVTVIILTDGYLVLLLLEAALRADKRSPVSIIPSDPIMFTFPLRSWSLVQVFFLVLIVVCGFANLYIQSGEIMHQTSVLTDRVAGLYYSVVTITIVGYGDFYPTGTCSRLLVVWQLVTGLLLLLGIFPLVVARITAF
jgi:hypothetical protein